MYSKLCLIVDDEPSIRAYVRAILEREQFQTMESENGVEALRLVEKVGGKLDVIVSDVQMPDGDGLTFIRSARELFPTLPIVMMSGFFEPDRQQIPGTLFKFVPKPFLPATLLKAISAPVSAL